MPRLVWLALVAFVSLALILGAGGIDAKKHRHHKHNRHPHVVVVPRPVLNVVDHLTPEWEPLVRQTIDDFNAVMPPHGPLLVYQRSDSRVCTEDITTCSAHFSLPQVGEAHLDTDTILLNEEALPQYRQNAVCHEFMHILTDIGDNYGARPDDSCVWGWQEHPGAFDVDRLRQTYP